MTSLRRLVTFVDLDDRHGPVDSISAHRFAELEDGRRIVLLDDRGWSSGAGVAGQTPEEVEETARVVVGPDEPAPGRAYAEMEAGHWATLAQRLRDAGVDATDTEITTVVHDIEISDRLRGLLRPSTPA